MLKKPFFNYIFIFVTLFSSTIVIDNVYAAAAESRGDDTELFFTPGKTVAKNTGKQLLGIKDTLIEIFGEEADEEYSVLFEDPVRTEDPGFRSALFRIKKKLEKRLGESDRIDSAFVKITQIRTQLEGIPEDRLEHYAEEYFKRMEGFEGIEFRAKPDGDQLGAKAIVTLSGKPSTFYIKSHSLGHRSISRSSGAKQLDSIELMVYAVLEQLESCPEVHFFGRDNKTSFIATADAGGDDAEFFTYESYSKDPSKKEALWGSEAYDYIKDTPFAERDTERLMERVDGNPQSRNLAELFARLDIISRIFILTDLIGNSGNFGFIIRPDGSIKLSIIDFRLAEDRTGSYSIENRDLNSFYVGNGIFSPLSVDPFVRHVLRDRTADTRATIALPHAQDIRERLSDVCDNAIEKVMGFIESISENIDNPEEFIAESGEKMEGYKAALLHNAGMYVGYLEAGAPSL